MRADPAETAEPADSAERRPPDLRLVPAAAAVWAVVLLGLELGPVAGGVVTAGAGAVGVVAHRRRWAPVALVVAGCAAAAGLVITAHTVLVVTHPLHGLAQRGAAATLRVVLRDDPRAVRTTSPSGGPDAARVVVPAELVEATAGAGHWTGGGRVLLLAPAPGWLGLLPGQSVTAEGLLAPAERTDLTVAVLRVRGAPGRSVRRRGGSRWRARSARGCVPRPPPLCRPPRQAFCPACPSATRARSPPRWMRTSAPWASRISWRFRGPTSPC